MDSKMMLYLPLYIEPSIAVEQEKTYTLFLAIVVEITSHDD